ncbi:MAG: sugar transporter, partial [Caballeronia sp.]|uniref:MFS transporter n=1 Tax=Caballeronia sp. TaxID=1931223 RepID=UPI002A3965E4|nr:sugar transporter [Caballeronia sp.]
MEMSHAPGDRALLNRVLWRVMPIVMLMYLIAVIDRQNVGFAKLQMVHALSMSEAAYGLASSLFFIGYLVFEVPSALAVHRYGARIWFARIVLTWGLLTIVL